MEAATSTMHQSFGFGPRGPNPAHGAQQAEAPHSGPPGAQRPEEQHQPHHKPFFYIQPSQPYLPVQSLQWPVPMPVTYNPYFGYPGLGYGMPLMPHYQPNLYTEPPSFVVPHTNLHLMDYRRILNPQYYQTLAYQSRRFRYQHNGHTKETTSSEVQTEPLSGIQRTSTPGTANAEAPSSPNIPTSISQALAVQNGERSLEPKDMMPPSSTRTSPNGSFVIQTEEVRIECCTTPVGLQVLHSHETAEVSHSYSQDGIQRSSVLKGCVLQDKALSPPADQLEQALQACPDILLVKTPSSNDQIPVESRSLADRMAVPLASGSLADDSGNAQGSGGEKDVSVTKNFQFKVVHLPFDPKYLDELRKMESSVWSMEDTLIPTPESVIHNGGSKFHNEPLDAEVPSTDVLALREEALTDDIVPMIEMPPLAEEELEDIVPAKEHPEVRPDDDMYPRMDIPVAEEAPMSHQDEVSHVPYLLLLDNSSPKSERSKHRRETTVQDHQDTSFESLPAYLPSTSWLADFDNVYYCSKMPLTPKKQVRPVSNHTLEMPSRRRKLDLEYKDTPTVRKPKERYKPKGKVDRRSLSDHECCLSRNFNENAFTPYASKRERLCSRCLSKRRICTPTSPGLDCQTLRRKTVPFQQWNDALLPTCEACKSHSKSQLMRKASTQAVCGPQHMHDTEGDSSENSSYRTGSKRRPADDPKELNEFKRPLASKQNVEKCPAVMCPKLREKNCVCNEPLHPSASWERPQHCPHGNTISEMDENCAMPLSPQGKWRNMNQTYLTHRWHTEKSWKAVMPNVHSSTNEVRSQHLNKHTKSQAQSQGTRRKDTRC